MDMPKNMHSAIAAEYEHEIHEATTEHLFGSETDPWLPLEFESDTVKYYVSQRAKQFGECMQDHWSEQRFFEMYWPKVGQRSPQLLFVEGKSGIGKSTFLTYFFRHYLPHLNKRPEYDEIVQGEPSQWANQIAHHVILHVSLRRIRNRDDLINQMNLEFASQLLGRFGDNGDPLRDWLNGDIRWVDNCALWDDIVGKWDSYPHRKGQKNGIHSEAHYRIEYLKEHNLLENKGFFVAAAMQFLGKQADLHGNRRYFLTCVFDNTDQMPDDLLLELIAIATRQVEDECPQLDPFSKIKSERSSIWKIIVPLRPETLRRLASSVDPLRNKQAFVLNAIMHEDLTTAREKRLVKLIENSGRHAAVPVPGTTPAKSALRFLLPHVAAQAVRDSFRANVSSDIGAETTEAIKKLFDGLVNDSARRLLILRRRLAMSHTIQLRLEMAQRDRWGGPPLSAFYFLDGLMCGESGLFDQKETENPICNLYDLGVSTGGSASLLVGMHAMWLLMQEGEWQSVAERLKYVGHSQSDIDACREVLIGKEIMRRLGKDENGIERYGVESSVVKAHWELLKERAYTDNAAISLAGSLKLSKAGEKWATNSLAHSDFSKRVKYSCRFLCFLNKCQNDFQHSSQQADIAATSDTGPRYPQQRMKQLPDIYGYVRNEYRSRISGLLGQSSNLVTYLNQSHEFLDVKNEIEQLP
jgi:hypothetical protein